MAGNVDVKKEQTSGARARAPVIAAFSGCGLARLRGLMESLALSMEGVGARGGAGESGPE
ncbi:MAG: hypothetical protein IT434_17100, partial [Phycisphaerales bacterium]|nr:hypothetical protein [Phycisphaerales bacterium]